MKINLPYQSEEYFFCDGSITGYHMGKVYNKLRIFLELIRVRSNFNAQYKGKGSITSDLCSHLKAPKIKEIFLVTTQTRLFNKHDKKLSKQCMKWSQGTFKSNFIFSNWKRGWGKSNKKNKIGNSFSLRWFKNKACLCLHLLKI